MSVSADITLNSDLGAVNATLTFGHTSANGTLLHSTSLTRFEFNDPLHVTGNFEATGDVKGDSVHATTGMFANNLTVATTAADWHFPRTVGTAGQSLLLVTSGTDSLAWGAPDFADSARAIDTAFAALKTRVLNLIGPFIDTTTLDTIQNAMKADTAIHAREIYGTFYNNSGATLPKGTPVYVSGFNVGVTLTEIDSARADNSAMMPAIGLLHDDISHQDSGSVIKAGDLEDQATNIYSVNDILFIGATGGLTGTRPTGTNLIQEMALIIRSHPTQGIIEVVNSGHTDDLPNLASANLWVGNASCAAIIYRSWSKRRTGSS